MAVKYQPVTWDFLKQLSPFDNISDSQV